MSISYLLTPLALCVEVKPSKYFCIAQICIALIALGAIFYADLVWPLRWLLVIVALTYSGYCWRQQSRQRGVLQWRSVWWWRGADGVERALRLRHCTVWPGLIVLVFQNLERAERFVLTLCGDSIDPDSARRLRVHLNHFPVFDSDNSFASDEADT